MNNRFYKGVRILDNTDPINSYILIDSPSFLNPCSISIENIGKSINLKLQDDVLKQMNVSSLDISDHETNPHISPDSCNLSAKTLISVDENYLYVWISKLSKWKRIPLSDW